MTKIKPDILINKKHKRLEEGAEPSTVGFPKISHDVHVHEAEPEEFVHSRIKRARKLKSD